MLSFIWWLIIGLVAGGLARLIMPGKDTMGWLATLLLGVAGSIIGGLVSWGIWGVENEGFRPAGLLLSLIGAILLLWVWRMVKSRTPVH
ncbi:MAG: GlsB/YeaQ/YmgE family stress response membrane protein [Pyrinomonadaceae bacterium]